MIPAEEISEEIFGKEDVLNPLIQRLLEVKWIGSGITILVAVLAFKGINFFIEKGSEGNLAGKSLSKKSKTYLQLIRSVLRYVFILLTTLIVLQINGVNVNSALAGVGIAGVVVGLALQDWLKDIIRGSSILSDAYFSVGDVIKYKDIEGKVLVIGLKTTKIQDMATGNTVSIANRNIEEAQIVSGKVYVRVPMPYEVPLEQAERTIEDILEILRANEEIKGCRYLGPAELAASSIEYLVEATSSPSRKLQTRRDVIRAIIQGLAKNNIEVPYEQLDVHQK